jgi:RimJ/RimL family protein N-acetyltransferase
VSATDDIIPVEPPTLEGRHVRLIPLSMTQLDRLCAIGLDPALWAHTTIRVRDAEEMRRYVQDALEAQAAGTALPFAIMGRGACGIVGTTRYHSLAREHGRLEIGFTWIATPWQRSAFNTEAKYLLLRNAFEAWRFERVEFRADVENAQSCRALERLGARREGTLRRYVVSPHKGPRDVALFAIIAADWPAVKSALEDRLAARPEN